MTWSLFFLWFLHESRPFDGQTLLRTVFLHENGRLDGQTVLSDQAESTEAICAEQDSVDDELEPEGHVRKQK